MALRAPLHPMLPKFTSGISHQPIRATISSIIARFATDLGTPLPIIFGPDGSLYYSTFGGGGTLYQITPDGF